MKRQDELGMTSVSYVLATGLSMVMLTWFALFIVSSYTRGVIRNSSERAVRAATVEYNLNRNNNSAIAACNKTFNDNIGLGVSDNQIKDISFTCSISGASAQIKIEGTLPVIGTRFSPIKVNETTSRKLER